MRNGEWTWTSHFTPEGFYFLICKMLLHNIGYIKLDNLCKQPSLKAVRQELEEMASIRISS